MKNIACVILAAGEGTRMKSSTPKVLHHIHGKPMIKYLVDTVSSVGIKEIVVVVGHKARLVRNILQGVKCIEQEEPLGTGDAVLKTKKILLKDKSIDSILVSYGDVPLLRPETLKKIVERHSSARSGCTLLTSHLKNPTGFGRILRSGDNRIVRIIEELDASIYEKVIEEINVGVYCFNKDILFETLENIRPNNRKKEYYLTDTVGMLAKANIAIDSVSTDDPEEFLGVNTRNDLIQAEQVVRHRTTQRIMQRGVTVIDPRNTYIEEGAAIDKDTVIYPYTFVENNVKIGERCFIGPFARLRTGTTIEDDVSIGNFVEIVRSRIGSLTKIKHQCYIGDTEIGKRVNIGAGTIVANYDGKRKYKTIIEDNAFIGTGTILIAPVKVGRSAVTGAGSVVTKHKNVPARGTVIGIPARALKKKKKR
ncbi:bifunctional N-acetylglucosamine-1-phosphate uridyltransferase/glucosamine-1-phosphate acetyltransferase [Candidatus Omnitrophota bacterium]